MKRLEHSFLKFFAVSSITLVSEVLIEQVRARLKGLRDYCGLLPNSVKFPIESIIMSYLSIGMNNSILT
jgi:hypothetical protein